MTPAAPATPPPVIHIGPHGPVNLHRVLLDDEVRKKTVSLAPPPAVLAKILQNPVRKEKC